MTFDNGNTYDFKDPDLSYFITNTQLVEELHNDENLIHSFLNDMQYNLNFGDKNSKRYYIIKDLINQNKYREIPYRDSQLGSGSNFVFLLADPDELVDQLKLIVFERVGGNDNPMLTTNHHQNLISTFTKKDQFVD